MEKSFKFKLTDAQKKEVADTLGISIDQVDVQVAYAQAIDEDAKGNDAVIATVGEKADDGKVWVVEQLSMAAQRPDGSNLVLDTASVAGGLEQGRRFNPGETKMAPTGLQGLQGPAAGNLAVDAAKKTTK